MLSATNSKKGAHKKMRMYKEILWKLPPKLAHSIIYGYKKKHLMHWKNPVTYDEKIHWLMVYVLTPEYGKYADKYKVREYVTDCGFADMLIPLYGVWNCVEDIDFLKLPYPNIIKLNNGSGPGYYQIMHSGDGSEQKAVTEKLSAALQSNFVKKHCEYHYASIPPKILCEKLLDEPVTDYKFVCSYGKCNAILVCYNRDQGRDYYTPDWVHTEYTKKEYQSGIIMEKPKCLPQMMAAAEKLSKPFALARIDFYEVNGHAWFGEITLSPSYGCHAYLTVDGQLTLGSFIDLKAVL